MKQEKASDTKVLLLLFFVAIFLNVFIADRALGHAILAIRNTYFVVVLCLFCLFVSLAAARKVELKFYVNIGDIILTGYFVYVIVNYFWWGGLMNDVFISFASLFLFYFITRQVFSSRDDTIKKIILAAFLLLGFFQGIHGLLQLTGVTPSGNSIFTVTGSFFNPAPYSVILAGWFVFSVSIYWFAPVNTLLDKILKYLAVSTMALAVVVLLFTESRTAWVACVAGVTTLFSIKYNLFKSIPVWLQSAKSKAIAVLIIIGILAVALALYKFKEASVHGRMLIWKIALNRVSDNPFHGIGFGGVRKDYNNWQAEYFEEFPDDNESIKTANQVNYLFNDYLQILLEEGVIGLSFFLLMIIFCGVLGFNTLRANNLTPLNGVVLKGALGIFISLTVTFFTTYSLESLPAAMMFFFSMAMISATLSSKRISLKAASKAKYAMPALFFVFAAFFLVLLIREMKMYVSYLQVTAPVIATDRLILFRNNYENLKVDPTYTLRYGKVLAEYNRHEESIDVLNATSRFLCDTSLWRSLGDSYQILGDFSNAERSYCKEIHIAPQRFTPRYRIVTFYLERGDTLKALDMAQRILKMPVKVESDYVDKVKIDMQRLLDRKSLIVYGAQ